MLCARPNLPVSPGLGVAITRFAAVTDDDGIFRLFIDVS
jgi:hypothetical protein